MLKHMFSPLEGISHQEALLTITEPNLKFSYGLDSKWENLRIGT